MNASSSHDPTLGRPWQDPAQYRAWEGSDSREAQVFSGLTPRDHTVTDLPTCDTTRSSSGAVKNTLLGSVPILMSGALVAGIVGTGDIPTASAAAGPSVDTRESADSANLMADVAERLRNALHPVSHGVLNVVAPHIPDTYTVETGDTISSIAARYGLPTAAVLGLNGLHINSLLHEGQVIKLTTAPTKQRAQAPPRVGLSHYVVQSGETVSSIAMRFGISQEALAGANNMSGTMTLIAGQVLEIPGTRQVTAPRAIPAIFAAQGQSSVVWASRTTSQIPGAAATTETSADSTTRSATGEKEAAPGDASVAADPLAIEIAEAPEVRVTRPSTPPPRAQNTPRPTPAPAPEPQAKPEPKPEPAPAPAPAPAAPAPAPAAPAASTASATPGHVIGQPMEGNVVRLPRESQREHARTVIRVGRELGVPDYGIVIALATAMQESSFRNITTAVDHDSLGLFQQRPRWWGSPEQLTDPVYATRVFFQGVHMPGVGFSRGLLGVSGWQNLPLTVAAQRVQRSAHPDAYAKWEPSAWVWLKELG